MKTGLNAKVLAEVMFGVVATTTSPSTATLTITPAVITNDCVGKLTTTITGLANGKTVRVEQFNGINDNIHEYPRAASPAPWWNNQLLQAASQ